jgi:hypothetical protein
MVCLQRKSSGRGRSNGSFSLAIPRSAILSHTILTLDYLYTFFFLYTIKAPSFVPRSSGVVSPLAKSAVLSQVYGSRSRSTGSSADIQMMPIGVPKVAYRVPGSQSADW